MQSDVDLHRDWLASINAMADALLGKNLAGGSRLNPLKLEVNRKFAELQEQLRIKHER